MASFELVVQVRDFDGKPTGKTKSLTTNSPEEMDGFWVRNTGAKSKKRPKASSGRKQSIKEKIFKKIDQLVKLEKGWDGRSALPVNNVTAQAGKEVISSLSDLLKFAPNVAPLTSGAFQVEFKSNKTEKELEIEFQDHVCIRYLMWDGSTGFSEEKEIGYNEIWKLRESLQWLMK